MPSTPSRAGSVVSLWRYPVKSMMGEELNASEVTRTGLIGDRAYALIDKSDGKVASAKNPRKWPELFSFRAALAEEPQPGTAIPEAKVTMPDGMIVPSSQPDRDQILSEALRRDVTFERTRQAGGTAEEYWPDLDNLEHRDTITDFELPSGTFFDSAVVHVLTTATLDRLRILYPASRFEVRRFRPNIVVNTGGDEKDFVENDWVGRTLAIGDTVRLNVTELCPRCVMTTLAQADLPKDTDILRAAAIHNRAHVGVYAAVLRGGRIRRGDPVTLE